MPEHDQDVQVRLADIVERLERIEGALNAFTVVYAIPRIPSPEEGDRHEADTP